MAVRFPLWLQNREYEASDDRHLIGSAFGYQPRVLWGMEMTAGPANNQVTIAPGQAIVGDWNDGTEMALVTNDAPMVRTITIASEFTYYITFNRHLESASVQSAAPYSPNVHDVPLAVVDVPNPIVITPGDITDARQIAPANMVTVGTDPPPALMLPGERYLRVS